MNLSQRAAYMPWTAIIPFYLLCSQTRARVVYLLKLVCKRDRRTSRGTRYSFFSLLRRRRRLSAEQEKESTIKMISPCLFVVLFIRFTFISVFSHLTVAIAIGRTLPPHTVVVYRRRRARTEEECCKYRTSVCVCRASDGSHARKRERHRIRTNKQNK